MGTAVRKMIQSFCYSGYLLKQSNHTFQVLIPKSQSAHKPTDFRPISLCNISYKIISKLLTNRLKPIITKIISPWQAAFVPGRNIADNTIIAHEVIAYMKRTKRCSGVFRIKLDMSKAFDRMEWSFLLQVMQKMDFFPHWCQLIQQCISTVSISLLVNGSPTPAFFPTRGLRQGDSLSSCLFIICMEGFSQLIQHAESAGLIKGVKPTMQSPTITHLFFEDDCLLFSLAKACEDILHMLHMQQMTLNEKYLGINLFTSRNKIQCFVGTIDKMQSRLPGWQGKIINQEGRSTQIQAVLSSMATFHMNYFRMPKKTIQALNRIQRQYWWNKSTSKGISKSWNFISLPKRFGGLGFKNPQLFNLAMLTKLAWRLVA